jgi:hypothetical protein
MPAMSTQASSLPHRSAGASIQGYCYQFDQTILTILSSSATSSVTVEGLEDIDVLTEGREVAIQVKYLASARYTSPAVLRKPVKLMLEAFAAGKDWNFILHVYFGDGSTAPKSLTLEELKECLTEHKRSPQSIVLRHYEASA